MVRRLWPRLPRSPSPRTLDVAAEVAIGQLVDVLAVTADGLGQELLLRGLFRQALGQVVGHPVERVGKVCDLVVARRLRAPPRVSLTNGVGDLGHVSEPTRDPSAREPGDENRHDHDEDPQGDGRLLTLDESHLDRVVQGAVAGDVVPDDLFDGGVRGVEQRPGALPHEAQGGGFLVLVARRQDHRVANPGVLRVQLAHLHELAASLVILGKVTLGGVQGLLQGCLELDDVALELAHLVRVVGGDVIEDQAAYSLQKGPRIAQVLGHDDAFLKDVTGRAFDHVVALDVDEHHRADDEDHAAVADGELDCDRDSHGWLSWMFTTRRSDDSSAAVSTTGCPSGGDAEHTGFEYGTDVAGRPGQLVGVDLEGALDPIDEERRLALAAPDEQEPALFGQSSQPEPQHRAQKEHGHDRAAQMNEPRHVRRRMGHGSQPRQRRDLADVRTTEQVRLAGDDDMQHWKEPPVCRRVVLARQGPGAAGQQGLVLGRPVQARDCMDVSSETRAQLLEESAQLGGAGGARRVHRIRGRPPFEKSQTPFSRDGRRQKHGSTPAHTQPGCSAPAGGFGPA